MTVFEVWAPNAQSMDVVIHGTPAPMARIADGWWRLDRPDAGHGTDYAFRINGGIPFPDPRSPWQPQGVHSASRVYDQARFEWHDQRFQQRPLSAALFYELHIGTFTPEGTFEAAIERFDYLVELGVTHIEILPVAEFPGERGWGYDGVDLWAPHHTYGGPDGLKRLVDAAHQKGLAVILDVVYNHLGPDGNYLGQYGPYFSERHLTPWGPSVNLDGPYSDEVRRFFIENAEMWLRDYHIDGLRLDAVHALFDTTAVHFLEELAAKIRRLEAAVRRRLVLIAESDQNDPRLIQVPQVGGYGLDAQWDDSFHHALFTLLSGERDGYLVDYGRVEQVAQCLRQGYVYTGEYSTFRKRRHGRRPLGIPSYRFLAYMQNHDQCGNRGGGERTGHLLTLGQLKIAAALLFTAPFVPMLFMGEEWAASTPFLFFTDHHDQALAQAITQGRRQEFSAFGWDPEHIPDPQDPQTMQRSRLQWGELEQEPHAGMLDWHRRLIDLRMHSHDLLGDWAIPLDIAYGEDNSWLVVRRGRLTVACNLKNNQQWVPLPPEWNGQVLLASEAGLQPQENGLSMPGHCAVILQT